MDPITQFFLNKLVPGDVLIYNRTGMFSWMIRHATNAPATHTEVFLGPVDGIVRTAASRDGIGVGLYEPNFAGLAVILRPKVPFDLEKALAFQRTACGEGYDWTGLWRAFVANQWGRNSTKEWCSENSTLVERAGGVEPFTPDAPADFVAPGDFLKSNAYTWVWKAKDFPL